MDTETVAFEFDPKSFDPRAENLIPVKIVSNVSRLEYEFVVIIG